MAVRWPITKPTLHRFLIGSAWFFIVVSLLHLAWVHWTVLPQPDGSHVKLYHTIVDGQTYDAVGLTYAEFGGVMQAVFQTALIVAAVIATVRAGRRWRRIGHGVLIAWAGLWLINLLWLTSLDHSLTGIGQSLVMATLFVATVYRGAINWNAPDGRQRNRHNINHQVARMDFDADSEFSEHDEAALLTADEIDHSGKVQPIDASVSKSIRPRIERAAQSTLRRSACVGRWTLRHVTSAGNRSLNWLREKGVLPGHDGSRETRSA